MDLPQQQENKHPHSSPWKFGIFYYNKEDKRIFPPKRSNLGWTVNFANPFSILAIIVLLTLIILIANYLSHLNPNTTH